MTFTGRLAVVVTLAASFLPRGVWAQGTDTAAWLLDFAQLKQAMASHYANLDWAVARRGLDLRQLSEATDMALRHAATDGEARHAIEKFLGAFGDGHLEVRWPSAASGAPAALPAAETRPAVRPVCSDLGFRAAAPAGGMAWALLPLFRDVKTPDSPYFAIGVLDLPGRGRVGILRIVLFSEHPFPELCEQAAVGMGLADDAPCDRSCTEALEREAANLFTAALERQIAALKRERIRALVVDVTRNGGGSEWAEVAARPLTRRPLRDSPMGFLRHEHWARQLADRLAAVEADMGAATGATRDVLRRAADVLRRQLAEAQRPCARDRLWEDGTPDCTLVVTEPPLYPSGVLPYARRGTPGKEVPCCTLFEPLRYAYHEGVYGGPLIVLVDRNTASAAEEFAALLADNGAATLLGEPTYGAGCGSTNGGISTVLEHSRGDVRMPDCVRFRADGTNEVEGITPDVLIPWRDRDSPKQKSERFAAALPAALDARPRRGR